MPNPFRNNPWTLLAAIVLLAALGLYSATFTVEAGTVGVVKTFGALSRVQETPGLFGKWLFPVQSVTLIDRRTRLLDDLGTEIQTRDKFNILVHLTVAWRIADPRLFVTRCESEAQAVAALVPLVKDARQVAVNSVRIQEIISPDPEQPRRFAEFEKGMVDALNARLKDDRAGFGVAVDFVRVRALAFPESVSQKVFDRMAKERQIASTTYRTQGEQEATILKQNAESDKQKLLADAEAEAIRLRGEGDAEAAKHYLAFKENPELANWLRKCDALRATLRPGTTVVLPTDHAPFDVLQGEAPAPRK